MIMTEYPFALEWEISEDRLKALKDSTNSRGLATYLFTVVHASNLQYGLSFHANGKPWLFLHVYLGNEKKAEAEYAFSIKSANWNLKMKHVFETSDGCGPSFCTRDELFDSNQKFIVDGKLKVKVEGIFRIENIESKTQPVQPKWETTPTFRDLWKIGYEDFTVVADGKEINVHKNVLASYSTVFDAMFNTKFNEGTENRVEITDFPFEVIQNAFQLCYRQKQVSDFSTDEKVWLLKFADKYNIVMIRESIEAYLSAQITVSNLHEMVKIAEEGNALNLQKRCLDFFIVCLSKKEYVPNVELLDKEFLVAAIKNSFCQKFQTI